uniref:SAM domain-containing protein n=1 Tax=Aureoumbra lagunensis TaxID=44058 RepID=A0A7S3K3V8_9STRA|mmetsp:Transcript_19250/g.24988  ORF Transcript_19250/g.24988 Transcript_19250/m.24988 type:complete len:771 (-) Transcript_19250:175-2487(-)
MSNGIGPEVLRAFEIFRASNRRLCQKYREENPQDSSLTNRSSNVYVPPSADEEVMNAGTSGPRKRPRRGGARLLSLEQEKALVDAVRNYRLLNEDSRLPMSFFSAWMLDNDLGEHVTVQKVHNYWFNHVKELAPDLSASKAPIAQLEDRSGTEVEIKLREREHLKCTKHFRRPTSCLARDALIIPRMQVDSNLTLAQRRALVDRSCVDTNDAVLRCATSEKTLDVRHSYLRLVEGVLFADLGAVASLLRLFDSSKEEFEDVVYYNQREMRKGLKERGELHRYESGELRWELPTNGMLAIVLVRLASAQVPKGGHMFPGRIKYRLNANATCDFSEARHFAEYRESAPTSLATGILRAPYKDRAYAEATLRNIATAINFVLADRERPALTSSADYSRMWPTVKTFTAENRYEKARAFTNRLQVQIFDSLDISCMRDLRIAVKLAIGQQLASRPNEIFFMDWCDVSMRPDKDIEIKLDWHKTDTNGNQRFRSTIQHRPGCAAKDNGGYCVYTGKRNGHLRCAVCLLRCYGMRTHGTDDFEKLKDKGPIFIALKANLNGQRAAIGTDMTNVEVKGAIARHNKECVVTGRENEKITGLIQARGIRRGAATDGHQLVLESRGYHSHQEVMDNFRWKTPKVYLGYVEESADTGARAFGRAQVSLNTDVVQMILNRVNLGQYVESFRINQVGFDILRRMTVEEFARFGIFDVAAQVDLRGLIDHIVSKMDSGISAQEAILSYASAGRGSSASRAGYDGANSFVLEHSSSRPRTSYHSR